MSVFVIISLPYLGFVNPLAQGLGILISKYLPDSENCYNLETSPFAFNWLWISMLIRCWIFCVGECFRNECFAGKVHWIVCCWYGDSARMAALFECLVPCLSRAGFSSSWWTPSAIQGIYISAEKTLDFSIFSLHGLSVQDIDFLFTREPTTILFKVLNQGFSPFIMYPSTWSPIQSLKSHPDLVFLLNFFWFILKR